MEKALKESIIASASNKPLIRGILDETEAMSTDELVATAIAAKTQFAKTGDPRMKLAYRITTIELEERGVTLRDLVE